MCTYLTATETLYLSNSGWYYKYKNTLIIKIIISYSHKYINHYKLITDLLDKVYPATMRFKGYRIV